MTDLFLLHISSIVSQATNISSIAYEKLIRLEGVLEDNIVLIEKDKR